MEISLTTLFKEGIGIDPSFNGISYANEVAKLSEMNNIKFIQGDEKSKYSLLMEAMNFESLEKK